MGDPIDDGEDSDSSSIGAGLCYANFTNLSCGRGMLSMSICKLKSILILTSSM